MVDLQEGLRETFAFEIRVTSDLGGDGSFSSDTRSYFARVDTSEECDEWIAEIKSAIKKIRSRHSEQHSAAARMQAKAKALADSTAWRCTVALAILLNFIICVVEAEYLPGSDSGMGVLLGAVDYILDAFFAIELLILGFGNWRTWCGSSSPAAASAPRARSVSREPLNKTTERARRRWGAPFVDSKWNWFHAATVAYNLSLSLSPSLSLSLSLTLSL